MTDRHTVDQINSDQLDALYDLNEATLAAATASYDAARAAETERDGAYRERAHLVALLAAMTPGAVIAPAPDVDEPGWQIVYLTIGDRQASWHISPRDAELFAAVEAVQPDDPRAQWDGHTTEEKYAGIAAHTAELAAAGPCWHTEPGTPCDWNECKQPERLAAGDYGIDPKEQR